MTYFLQKNNVVQSKLSIGQPNDRYEREADHVADQVMHVPQSDTPIQRQCEDCDDEALQMKPLSASISPIIQKREREDELQMKGLGGDTTAPSSLQSSLQQSKGGGQSLDASTNEFMSNSIGADFSQVKVHTDNNAIQMNRQLNARAFTNGSDVYFNQGQYDTQSSEGKHLLAHELTHVVQQGSKNASESRNRIQRYVAYKRWDQTGSQSEQELETTSPSRTFTKGRERRYKRRSTRFNEKYKRQNLKGRLTARNKRKKEGWRHPKRRPLLISDDGRMVVEDSGSTTTRAWADETLINNANKVLEDSNSYVTLKKETSDLLVGNVPKNENANPYKGSYKSIKPVHITENGEEQDMTKAANTVESKMETRDDESVSGKSKQNIILRDCGMANNLLLGMVPRERFYKSKDGTLILETEDPNSTIQNYIQLLMQNEFPDNADMSDEGKAYYAYKKLSKSEKIRVDEKYGLNTSARPDLGEGVTTVATEYEKESASGYNFHFATNVMQSDSTGDYIALEGLVDNSIWYFSMYGTLKEQSFHEKVTDTVDGTDVSVVVDK